MPLRRSSRRQLLQLLQQPMQQWALPGRQRCRQRRLSAAARPLASGCSAQSSRGAVAQRMLLPLLPSLLEAAAAAAVAPLVAETGQSWSLLLLLHLRLLLLSLLRLLLLLLLQQRQ